MTNLKEALFQQCVAHVNMRLQTIQTIISSHQKALSSETKSSAGDKHEIGRAMLQLEMEKAGQQLAAVQQMEQILARVAIAKPSISVRLGTIIETSSVHYFLSVSAGKLTVNEITYFAISASSPIGQLIVGKQVGDTFIWRGKEIKIDRVL
jgi:transcription elongation GreA/GreB family factor